MTGEEIYGILPGATDRDLYCNFIITDNTNPTIVMSINGVAQLVGHVPV